MSFNQLLNKARRYLPPEKLAMVEGAYNFALKAHEGQWRKSGEPYLEHPLQIALTLAELQLDATALVAALLHDVTEDCGVPISQIKTKFGSEVAKLVDGTTKLGRLSLKVPEKMVRRDGPANKEQQAENLRKMLVATAEDLRVVFIKLADRLHNMYTLDALSPEKRRSIARETMEIYAPLAHRLGIWEMKGQLEDLSFRYLEPQKYNQIVNLVAARHTERESFITEVITILKKEFDRAGLKADISGRAKHLYSSYQKMEKYSALGKDFNDMYDLLALRVLVSAVPDCYSAVGLVHHLWHPLPGSFDDSIANPRPNGYQSLHTAIMCLGTIPIEVQVRTHEMHRIAEYGVAAHWRYKEGGKKDIRFEERIGWLRQLIDWHRELSGANEFLESVKTDIFKDQVFVFTPKGEIKDLPKGSTSLDFAYRVHTELGHRCIGAKINGRLMSFEYQLNNGDVVEILSAKRGKGPSRDWLSPPLGYVRTSHARQKIRQWFKKQERADNIERGRELLERELKRLGLKGIDREALTKLFKYASVDDFLAAIGYGDISAHHIALKLVAQQERPRAATDTALPKPLVSTVQVLGVGDLLTNLGGCCHPVPGDKIVGYVTRSRGVTVHRRDCYNVVSEDEKERLVNAEWGQADSFYPVRVQVEAWDRVGLIRDISTAVAEEKVNIANMSVTEHDNGTTSLYFILETRGLAQLGRLLAKIASIRGMVSVARVGDESMAKSSFSI